MIKIITLFGIYGLSLTHSNRVLLQTNPVQPVSPLPPGHMHGAHGQYCAHPEPGAVICSKITEVANDLAHPGFLSCERPNDCCLCSSISCGSDTIACEVFGVGNYGAFGNKQINIIADPFTPTLIDCKGSHSCANTIISATAVTKVQCGGQYSCKGAIITIEEPNAGFELKCGRTGSCDGLVITLNVGSPPAIHNGCNTANSKDIIFNAIECIGVSACNNLVFIVNNVGCDNVIFETIECREGSCQSAQFMFDGIVNVVECMLATQPIHGIAPLGLQKCFTGLKKLTCPEYAACENERRTIIDPANGFELLCEAPFSCHNGIFSFDITTFERSEAFVLININCVEQNSCKNLNVIVNNSNVKQVKVNVKCMSLGSCQNAVFMTGFGVTIQSVLCENPSFCVGCTADAMSCDPNAPILPIPANTPNAPVVV